MLTSHLDAFLSSLHLHYQGPSSFLPIFTLCSYIFTTSLNGHLSSLPISKFNLLVILPKTRRGDHVSSMFRNRTVLLSTEYPLHLLSGHSRPLQ